MRQARYLLVGLVVLAGLVISGPTPGSSDGLLAQAQESIPELSEALHVFPPLGSDEGTPAAFDATPAGFVGVFICRVDPDTECYPVAEYTGGDIRVQNRQYHVNWTVPENERGATYRVTFSVAGLDIGELSHVPASKRTLPIKFRIDSHPVIQARVMYANGASAMQIGGFLAGEGVEAEETAQILHDWGFSGTDTCQVLKQVFSIDDVSQLEAILGGAGYSQEDYIGCAVSGIVERFAPILEFNFWPNHLPMDAEVWFDEMLCGEQGGPSKNPDGIYNYAACRTHDLPWGNVSMDPLNNDEVPTYYRVRAAPDGSGQLRIDYWWFYGHQPECLPWQGDHVADWEHVKIITNQARTKVAAVVYYQHAGWYTKIVGQGAPNFPYVEVTDDIGTYARPIVIVGMNSHGAYHNPLFNPIPGTQCSYFEDTRIPATETRWNTYESPLVNLDGNEQAWLAADREADWLWQEGAIGTHPTQREIEFDMRSCEGYNLVSPFGCGYDWLLDTYSDCKTGHQVCRELGVPVHAQCADGWADCLIGNYLYPLDWVIPTTDIGLIP